MKQELVLQTRNGWRERLELGMNFKEPEDQNKGKPILSDFLDDESMVKIIQDFLNEIPHRIEMIESHFDSGNKEELCRIVHQLKGAGGGYGFKIITTNAQALEKKIRLAEDAWQKTAIKARENLVAILYRVYAGRNISGQA